MIEEEKGRMVCWVNVPFFFFSVVLALVLRVVVFSLGIVVVGSGVQQLTLLTVTAD